METVTYSRKRLVSIPEQNTRDVFESIAKFLRIRVYTKFKMSDCFRLMRSGITDEDYRYALTAHFDFVFARDEEAILAIELDGRDHWTDEHQIEKDSTKRSLCDRFSLPLIRLDQRIVRSDETAGLLGLLSYWWVSTECARKDRLRTTARTSVAESQQPYVFEGGVFPHSIPSNVARAVDYEYSDGILLDTNQMRTPTTKCPCNDMRWLNQAQRLLARIGEFRNYEFETLVATEASGFVVSNILIPVAQNSFILGQGRCLIGAVTHLRAEKVAVDLATVDAACNLQSFRKDPLQRNLVTAEQAHQIRIWFERQGGVRAKRSHDNVAETLNRQAGFSIVPEAAPGSFSQTPSLC